MNDIVIKAILSCAGALFGFLLCLVWKPLSDYLELKNEIRRYLIEYDNCYGDLTCKEKIDIANNKYREFSGRLSSVPHLFCYSFYRYINKVPSKEDLIIVKNEFIRFSNLIYTDNFDGIRNSEKIIRQLLGLEES